MASFSKSGSKSTRTSTSSKGGGTRDFSPDALPDLTAFIAPTPVEESLDALANDRLYLAGDLHRAGGMGAILLAEDRHIGRQVAMKVLPQDHPGDDAVLRLITEAKITGQLEHPNIVPVHHLGVDHNNRLFYTMKYVQGRSLRDILKALRLLPQGSKPPYSLASLLTIFQKICDAVAFAHSRGIIHRDLKPSNIMVGDFGETLVVDWGLAKRVGEPDEPETATDTPASDTLQHTLSGQILGTPGFMAPEQARGDNEAVEPRTDIYALGAILYNILTLHQAFENSSDSEILAEITEGRFAEPMTYNRSTASPETQVPLAHCPQGRVPSSLNAVVMTAMAQDPDERYASVKALQADIDAYQNNFPTAAERAGLIKRIYLLWRRRRKDAAILGAVATAALLLLGLGIFMGTERARERANWGQPIVDESFNDNSWATRWRPEYGQFIQRDGGLVTSRSKDDQYSLIFRQPCLGATAIEFDCEMLPGYPAGDLSVVWLDETLEKRRIYFQTGAWQNTHARIAVNGTVMAYHDTVLKRGVRYRFRAEIEGTRMTLWLDGRKLCEHHDDFPTKSGYIGLYGFYAGKTFDNVRIYSKGVAEQISVVDIGDSFFRRDMFVEALQEYDKVVSSHAGRPVAAEARYKRGMCHYALAHREEEGEPQRRELLRKAYAEWDELAHSHLAERVQLQRLKRLFTENRYDELITHMADLYAQGSPSLRIQIGNRWEHWMRQIHPHMADQYHALGKQLFANDPTRRNALARLQLSAGDPQGVLDHYPDDALSVGQAMFALGRMEEALAQSPLTPIQAEALYRLGRHNELLQRFPLHENWCALALISLGQANVALEQYGHRDKIRVLALFAMGRFDEIIAEFPNTRERYYAEALAGNYNQSKKGYNTHASIAYIINDDPEWVLRTAFSRQRHNIDVYARALLLTGATNDVQEKFPTARALHVYVRAGVGDYEPLLAVPLQSRATILEADSQYLQALQRFIAGDEAAALERMHWLKTHCSFAPLSHGHIMQWSGLLFSQYIMPPCLLASQGETDEMRKQLSGVVGSHGNHYGGQLSFMASYILGEIDEEGFLSQPTQLWVEANLILARALREDFVTQSPAAALPYYRRYAELPYSRKDLNPVTDAFVSWRLATLGAQARQP